jgi:predicted AAA+ superfamily ATPase
LIANDFYASDDLTKSIDDISFQKIDSIYNEKLKTSLAESVDDINSNIIFSKTNVTDVDQYLTDNDIELIYSQLIEKKIL